MKVRSLRIANWKSFADSGTIELDDINLIVGRNNSGKSAVLRALYLMQIGAEALSSDVRLFSGERFSAIATSFSGGDLIRDLEKYFRIQQTPQSDTVITNVQRQGADHLAPAITLKVENGEGNIGANRISHTEPNNFIYPYLARRKVTAFDTQVDGDRVKAVTPDLRNLTAKVLRLADSTYGKHVEFTKLCDQVLGFRVGVYAAENGQKVGRSVGPHDHIPIEAMGEGVASQLGLIVDLCMADGNLLLIEELENDIHPQALKAILRVIVEKSASNQFVISTHNNIVLKYLGAESNARIFTVASTFAENGVPTSTIEQVENTPAARVEVLRQLGYELHDFDFHEGYLFLEESSAQTIIRDYLVRWFTPRLTRLQIVSTSGVDRIKPFFEDFRRLFLFTHLESHYQGRAWVVTDGDDIGKEAIEKLQKTYKVWEPDHFRTWSEADFERYYPARFKERVDNVLALNHHEKPAAKKQLLAEVTQWCDDNEDQAKAAFAASAAEVVAFLQEIDRKLFGTR
ncbi:ATP-dependent nuclease [Kibdelosporangium aridum]|uniref:ATPase/GTPase, AAA15 family n=1 Tax=Kibdelosporangium aridum TaxID=2030 RepID=A0A1Y5XVQ9_KIBAR|nr:AAA family ATPase [Kibdelosporangium aridum]SMD14627.1 ATPase/GTPase, AAA15 family [Kibdelosporangium aridum]